MSTSLSTSLTFSEKKLCPDDHWPIQSPCSLPCSLSQDMALLSVSLTLCVTADWSICCAMLSLISVSSLRLCVALPTSELHQSPTIWFNALHSWRLQCLILGPHHHFLFTYSVQVISFHLYKSFLCTGDFYVCTIGFDQSSKFSLKYQNFHIDPIRHLSILT